MANNRSPRSRSTTSAATSISNGHRPVSRQSTTSIQSNVTQPGGGHPGPSYQTGAPMPSSLWQQHQDSQVQMSAHHMQHASNHYMVDNSMHPHGHGSFPQDHAAFQGATAMHMGPPTQMAPMENKDNLSFDVNMNGGMMVEGEGEGNKRKKGSATSQANDLELRRLFRENENRDLHDVAQQVIRDEKGPKAEKAKQIFGMLWLYKFTKRSSSSVPRNRVFTSYATRCGTERVPPLNPASFGKLVRIIFPGITTRRLGVRGESKYHYVELSLVEDNRSDRASVPRGRSMTVDSQRDNATAGLERSKSRLPNDIATFPSMDDRPKTANESNPDIMTSNIYPQVSTWGERSSEASRMIQRPLQFTSTQPTAVQTEISLDLPSIEPYIPPGTDMDAVDSLTSVYRSHCLLAIDNFRYCKTEKLCDSYKSLVGLLTVPGQKLLAHPSIAAWIRVCDWMKYQRMIPMLDAILLSQVPKRAMAHMEHVSQHICGWISQFFQNQPKHTQKAMLGPTNIFASLLERFLRVNRAALDVAQVLEDQSAREEIWRDWVAYMKPLHVLQSSLLDHGHKRVLHILTQDSRYLLGPINADTFLNTDPLFADSGVLSSFQQEQTELEGATNANASIIGRLSRFLQCLASRFPGVDARSMLNHVDVIGNNISRNLTLNGAPSLGNWWRIKLFVDEMSYWLAEKGGFLSCTPDAMDASKLTLQKTPVLQTQNSTDSTVRVNSQSKSQISEQAEDASAKSGQDQESLPPRLEQGKQNGRQAPPNQSNPTKQTRPRTGSESTVMEEDDGLATFGDDSGIAMGLEEDFAMDTKYNTFVDNVGGSDPADVVVC